MDIGKRIVGSKSAEALIGAANRVDEVPHFA
jgi:hypothetical protein